MTGYSRIELCGKPPGTGKRWQEITHPDDLGHDEYDVDAMLAGEVHRYSKTKRFKTRDGRDVHCVIHVNRFPTGLDDFVCFIGEAVPTNITKHDIERLQHEFDDEQKRVEMTLAALATRLSQIEGIGKMHADNSEQTTKQSTSINIGNGSTVLIAAIVIVLATILGYVVYLTTWRDHGGDAAPPPQIESIDKR